MARDDSSAGLEASIVSGYFNPLHVGHLDLLESARSLTGHLIVIVNNDNQQQLKKGKLYTVETERLRLVQALSVVDEAFVSIDDDNSVTASLNRIRLTYESARLLFCNGGDRVDPNAIPQNEAQVCRDLGIQMCFGVGGVEKRDSSSRLIALSELADDALPRL